MALFRNVNSTGDLRGMKLEQYLLKRFGISQQRQNSPLQNFSSTRAADVGGSELSWCSKELRYLSTDLDSGRFSVASKRVKRVREQLNYVENLLDDIEQEELQN